MSLTVAGGLILGSADLYQDWDPTLSRNPSAAFVDNRGCAPGWATIYVQDSLTGGTVKVCRRLDAAVLGPQAEAVIREESGPDWYDASIISVASAAEQVVEAGGQVFEAVTPSPLGLTATALLVGAVALLLFAWKR